MGSVIGETQKTSAHADVPISQKFYILKKTKVYEGSHPVPTSEAWEYSAYKNKKEGSKTVSVSISRELDSLGRPTHEISTIIDGDKTKIEHTWISYDAEGKMTEVREQKNGYDKIARLTYDGSGRLISETTSAPEGDVENEMVWEYLDNESTIIRTLKGEKGMILSVQRLVKDKQGSIKEMTNIWYKNGQVSRTDVVTYTDRYSQ